jgi:acetate---CoA ligase (ADP-forming)
LIQPEGKKKAPSKLNRLLRPGSIALVGASSTPGSLGDSVLLNLENAGFGGAIYLVNPKRPLIRGRQALGSIDELPEGIDCAVLAIPGAAVLEAAHACARKRIGSLIVFSAGFAESGEAGKTAQHELAELARAHDMVIEGPNCLGMVNFVDSIPLTFVVTPPQSSTEGMSAGAAIVSQSGALAAVIAVNMRHHGIRLTYSISTGNEASHGAEDFIEHLIEDAETRVLVLVIEQFRSPKRFLELARRARQAQKYLVLLHPGSSGAARSSAATHTGAMAGDYQVMHTLVTHAGVVHVESLEELVDVAQVLARVQDLPRKGAAVFTESGAFKALTLDLCERIGLDLPQLSPKAVSALRQALPAFIPVSNPLDLTAQGLVDPGLYRRTLPAVLEDDQFGSALLGIILTDPTTTALKLPPILDAIRTLRPKKPVIFAALDEGAPFDAQGIGELRQLGVACFPSTERALRALKHVTDLGQRRSTKDSDRGNVDSGPTFDAGILPEYRAKAVLKECGIAVLEGALARTADEAADIARKIGFPVALKAQAVDLPHKSDAGGVILNVVAEIALRAAWTKMHENLERSVPGTRLEGVLVERMGARGFELIVGARNDAGWGPVLLVGAGGVFAEAMQDVLVLPGDLPPAEFAQEMQRLQCAPLLRGFRGSAPLDVAAAAEMLARLGALMRSHPEIEEVDINPVVLYPRGEGALAFDALMKVGSNAG